MLNHIDKHFDFESGVVLPIDKPYGWTSADVVRKIKAGLRRIGYKKIKIGHAGTLDPLATGILLICIGKATKQAESLQAQPKEYLAEIELGATTPSYDLEHEVDERYPYTHITREAVIKVLDSFKGVQQQIPPVFSAKAIDGKRAYKYARNGEEVEMKAAEIEIYDITLEKFELPSITVRMRCSKGTYVRALARDIGLRLESGGHLTALRRTANANFTEEEAWPLEKALEIFPQSETK